MGGGGGAVKCRNMSNIGPSLCERLLVLKLVGNYFSCVSKQNIFNALCISTLQKFTNVYKQYPFFKFKNKAGVVIW